MEKTEKVMNYQLKFLGRDGYRKGAHTNPNYDYHQVDAVYEMIHIRSN